MIRKAIDRSGESLNAIADATGVNQVELSRFMQGKRSSALDTAERICEYLGLELRGKQPPAKKPKNNG